MDCMDSRLTLKDVPACTRVLHTCKFQEDCHSFLIGKFKWNHTVCGPFSKFHLEQMFLPICWNLTAQIWHLRNNWLNFHDWDSGLKRKARISVYTHNLQMYIGWVVSGSRKSVPCQWVVACALKMKSHLPSLKPTGCLIVTWTLNPTNRGISTHGGQVHKNTRKILGRHATIYTCKMITITTCSVALPNFLRWWPN